MAEHPLEMTVRTALWQQFGAAIDMLEHALIACPDTLWQKHLWTDAEGPTYGTFWDITYHTLYWLDLYLTGLPAEEFAPPAPFKKRSDDIIPTRPWTKDELHGYLVHLRQKCQATMTGLSEEQAHQPFTFPWPGGPRVSYIELQFCTMRHVQEHTAQLSLFLGQHGIPDETLDWVMRAEDGQSF